MLNKLMGNKKLVVILAVISLILVFVISFIIGYTNAINKENKQSTSETKKEYNETKKEVETKTETNEQVSDENETEETSNDWIDYEPTLYDVVLRNNEIQLSTSEEAYPNLEPTKDNVNLDKRFIIPEIVASFRIPRDYDIKYKKRDNGAVSYRLESTNSKGYIRILAVPANIRDGKDIYDIAKYLYEEKYVEINQYLNWKYFRVNNSHIGMYYHRPDDNRTFAIIRDANGNLISIGASGVDDWIVFDMMVNFESFGTAGFRFVDQKDRDGIYIDKINSVSMK